MNQPASENSIDLSNVCCDNSTSASSSSSGTILTKKQSTSGLVIDPPLDPQSHSVLSDVMQSIGIHSSPSSSSSSSSATLNGTAGSSIGVAWPKSSLVPDVNNKVESTPNTSNHNNSNTPGVTSATSSSSNASTHNLWAQQWIERLSQQIISDMNSCGICVIDNFLGESRCDVIMSEVHSLYASGHFRNGQLVKGGATPSNSDIRSDKIMWVDGNESECRNIGFLMRTLDKIVRTCTNQTATSGPDDGFEHKNITNRTKAMLACYPGSGTQYVKHVDNPNQDGRAITCIYYLNKNWDVAKNGGLLRIFPKGIPYVANIAPLFDRLVFFYSDRRNPHEVQPAFAVRFAITLWYYDGQERERHIQRFQNVQSTSLST